MDAVFYELAALLLIMAAAGGLAVRLRHPVLAQARWLVSTLPKFALKLSPGAELERYQENAWIPVWARPSISAWISWVPS